MDIDSIMQKVDLLHLYDLENLKFLIDEKLDSIYKKLKEDRQNACEHEYSLMKSGHIVNHTFYNECYCHKCGKFDYVDNIDEKYTMSFNCKNLDK